jgi:hypothetical protein
MKKKKKKKISAPKGVGGAGMLVAQKCWVRVWPQIPGTSFAFADGLVYGSWI